MRAKLEEHKDARRGRVWKLVTDPCGSRISRYQYMICIYNTFMDRLCAKQ